MNEDLLKDVAMWQCIASLGIKPYTITTDDNYWAYKYEYTQANRYTKCVMGYGKTIIDAARDFYEKLQTIECYGFTK